MRRVIGVEVVTGETEQFVDDLRQTEGKQIWLVGGSQLIYDLMSKQLVDELILSIHPIVLGEGIPLFASQTSPRSLNLTKFQSYSSDLVHLSYNVVR